MPQVQKGMRAYDVPFGGALFLSLPTAYVVLSSFYIT